uniref:Uncharacterized protein n=1 Tax=Fagus sylvatica TaxID=28930 RepID=A0A2N9FQG9_FAGSY
MASSSSQNNYDAIDLNAAPSAAPEVWRPYFLSLNGPVTVTDSVMLSGTTATVVAAGLFTLEDGRVLAERRDPQTINDLMALTIQCVASVSNMGRHNKKKVVELKEENKELKKLVDSYASDLVARSIEQSKTTAELQKQYEKLR